MTKLPNQLYYGDNLDVLRRYIKDESVDLVYLDPPFKSDQDYNVLFAEHSGERAAAQIKAFEDTWRWDMAAEEAFADGLAHGGRVAEFLAGLRRFLGESDMMAYLAMMAPRLIELRRVLKSTGSIYLHCDPTASHYLKLLMDAVFGIAAKGITFRNEIIWKRSSSHGDTKQGMKRCGRIHDVILFYTKTNEPVWNPVYTPYDESYLESLYRFVDENGRRYREGDLTAAKPGGDVSYEWRVKRKRDSSERWVADLEEEFLNPKEGWEYLGVTPYKGRYWAYSKQNMAAMWRNGLIIHRSTGFPQFKRYLDEQPGVPLQDIWIDINPLSGSEKERLGYPTQKPEALLERIIRASCNEGSVVLDPFCGCGTAVVVAQRLKRRWIGIDITHLAIGLIKHRLNDVFGVRVKYDVIGEPTSLPDAQTLAKDDRYQFQWWALGLAGARPVDQIKGADKGIDGSLFFQDDRSGKPKRIVFSVKSGGVGVRDVRDLRGVLDRESAAIGVLITLESPTKPMLKEAASARFYESSGWHKKYPRLQIITIQQLLDGVRIEMPPANVTYKKAIRVREDDGQALNFLDVLTDE